MPSYDFYMLKTIHLSWPKSKIIMWYIIQLKSVEKNVDIFTTLKLLYWKHAYVTGIYSISLDLKRNINKKV